MAQRPPPLPPRGTSEVSLPSSDGSPLASPRGRSDTVHLTPYSNSRGHSPTQYFPYSGGLDDPRASSTQSLRPIESAGENRKTLLLIYIHGFLGDETSFKSFPAHVHNVLTTTLAESHVVHTKIYPRYKSRKNISFARDDFSNWLTPHESSSTDLILVGHSLGGILAAEVVLIPGSGHYEKKHRILGTVAFDVPFLGMHPGVISTGITSLFRSAPEEVPELEPSASGAANATSPYLDPSEDPSDPNYNPAFGNDVRMAVRTGKLEKAWYFWNKHWGELGKATSDYVTSHLDFGGCLADYPGLRRRYEALRALEDVDETSRPRAPTGRLIKRARFVNYYSASTGRVKERRSSHSSKGSAGTVQQMNDLSLHPSTATTAASTARSLSPRISLEEHRDGQIVTKNLQELPDGIYEQEEDDAELTLIEPKPESPTPELDSEPPTLEQIQNPPPEIARTMTSASANEFSPLPPLPEPPAPFDASIYTTTDALKLAQKEYGRQVKAYERVKKERDKTLKDREKLLQKRQKAAQKEQEKQLKEQFKRSATLNADDYDKQLDSAARVNKTNPSVAPKKQRDRKFCTLPSKDKDGRRDPTWVRVYMEGMDEVVAHTSMFKMSETYAKLVGDTVARIEEWVGEDATVRAVMEEDKPPTYEGKGH